MKKTPMMAAGINPASPKMMVKFFKPKQSSSSNIYKLYIYDDVSAYGKFDWSTWTYLESQTSASYFKEQLEMIPDTATIEMYVNSNGGSVKEGTSIFNQLYRHKAYKVAYVDGFAYSVASLICMACDKIIMGMGTSMLIHNMWMTVTGNAEELRKAADDLDALMTTNKKIYLQRSGGKISEEDLDEIMISEKILTPEDCLLYGFADEILENGDNPDDNPDDDPEDNPDDDPEDNSDDNPGDNQEKEQYKIMPLHMIHRQEYIRQRQELQRQMEQLNANPATGNTDKCIQFFNQFI